MRRLPDTELEVMKALWASGPDTPRAAPVSYTHLTLPTKLEV